jgi:predicted ATPase/DNA-binding winged helix-turn-helix (wHTH) protein
MAERGSQKSCTISFGPFRVNKARRLLEREGAPVQIGSRAFDILAHLLEHAGEIVSRGALMNAAWPETNVEDGNLRFQMTMLRHVLGSGYKYIINVPGRGYSLVAPIWKEREDAPQPNRSVATRYHLPCLFARMVGRSDTVHEICVKLRAHRLVTIVGPGGIGKTTVALSVAHALLEEFHGGVCFVDLSTLNDPRLLGAAVSTAFNFPVQSQDPIPNLIAQLRDRRVLLVLDSSEHLIAEVTVLTERLLEAVEDLCILATSREVLRAQDEIVYRLLSLESPPDDPNLTAAEALKFPAAQLFVDRATTGGGLLALSDPDAVIVGNICRKLGGIALAIELAAGRVQAFGLRETADLLDSQFALRWPGLRTAPPRHQTLSATLDWSYNLLSDAERAVLRRLSAFVGTFTLEGARQVAGALDLSHEEVIEAVAGLVAKSLASAETAKSLVRYRLLDTTRTYAAMKMLDAREREDTLRRHALYYRDLLRSTESEFASAPQATRASASDVDNVRAALHWAFGPDGDRSVGSDLAAYSASLWLGKALFTECRDWMTTASALFDKEGEIVPQQLLVQAALAASVVFTVGFSDEFKTTWTRTLELALGLGDVPRQLIAHLALWGQVIRAPRYEDALIQAEKCAEVAAASKDPGARAMAEWMLGITMHHMGRLASAETHLQRGLDTDIEVSRMAQLRQTGVDRRVDGMAAMGNLLWIQGFPTQASRICERAIEEAQPLGCAVPSCVAMTWALFNKYLSGTDIEAIEYDAVQLIEYARTYSVGSYEGFGLCVMGLCQARYDQFASASPLVLEGVRLFAESRYELFTPIVLAHLCEAAVERGHLSDADSLMNELERVDANHQHWCTPETLRVKGVLARHRSETAALDYFSQSAALARKQGALSWELRTAMSQSKMWAERGRIKDAFEIVQRPYNMFAEGFDTADLIAATRMIDDLSSAMPDFMPLQPLNASACPELRRSSVPKLSIKQIVS